MNNIVKKHDTRVPATTDKNPFEQYADDVDSSTIIGSLLKFSKGDWLVGKDGAECEEEQLVAVLPGLLHGWVRWEGGKPVEQIMGLVTDGFQPPKRSELGYDDEALWESGDNGPRDPWQPTVYLPMVSLDGGTVYTFSSSSDGGRRRGIAPLCREYGHHMRQCPDELPVVRLDQSSYLHTDKSKGRIKYPLFPIKNWVKAAAYINAVAAEAGRLTLPDNGAEAA
jgi:hypothetical protein